MKKLLKFLKKNKEKALLFQWFGIQNPLSSAFETYSGTIGKATLLVDTLAGASGLVAVGIIVFAGYTYITAGGEAEKIDQATKMVTNAVIGLVIVFIARLIILFVIERVLGL